MKGNRKASTPKEIWQAKRRRYTWHLLPPFKVKFDRSQWWKKEPNEIEPAAALYELARRHPLVNETPPERTPLPGMELPILPSIFQPKPSLRLTQRLGLKSWPKLTASERQAWKTGIGRMKSFDFRPCESISINITRQADLRISQKWHDDFFHAQSTNGYCGLHSYGSPTDQEWKDAILQCAAEAHRQGYVLIAIEPNLTPDKAAAAMLKQYREHDRAYLSPKPKQRARRDQWMYIISDFEEMVMESGKWNAQIFARYRRVVDGIQFE